jgi:dihydrofolate synthase/folylpolyglutamate synthase
VSRASRSRTSPALLPAPSASAGLVEWLAYLEALHPATIDLGLDRVAAVRDSLGLRPPFPIITVGGTNGKGSTCALLESCLRCAGYRTGLYTSPHLLRYNERVRIDGRQADDASLVRAFEKVERARGDYSLTYFEFGTLAAVLMFIEARVEVGVLEVGLGGRLDAVNAFEPSCAIVTSVDLDHQNYLGPTREHIGREKAGIMRGNVPVVIADPEPPLSLMQHAQEIGAQLYLIDRDFGFSVRDTQWEFWDWRGTRAALPWPALRGEYQLSNASAALAALDTLRDRLPVDMGAIRRGLVEVDLPARFQVLPGRPTIVLDVAHNPHAAQRLAQNLHRMERRGRRFAVFAMLKDKDIAAVLSAVRDEIDEWLIAPLSGARGADLPTLKRGFERASIAQPMSAFDDVEAAYAAALERAQSDDKIVVFGSFFTVAGALHRISPDLKSDLK